jgi:MFS family permease
MAAGLGLTLGPFLSGIVYSYLHYAGTFFCFALILAITGIFLFIALPSRLNTTEGGEVDEEEDDSNGKIRKIKNISYKIFFQ